MTESRRDEDRLDEDRLDEDRLKLCFLKMHRGMMSSVSAETTFLEISRWGSMASALLVAEGAPDPNLCLESFSEAASNLDQSLLGGEKKISMSTHTRSVDNLLVYIFLKQLLTIPKRTKAYRLGLIDDKGKLKRNPETSEETESLSNLDLLAFNLREWLKPHLSKLSRFSWLSGVDAGYRVQNALGNTDALSKRASVIRINNELGMIL